MSSWGWAHSCSIHVEDSSKHIIEEIAGQVGYLPELYEDARSEKIYIEKIYAKTYLMKRTRFSLNPLNADLNPICHLLALLGTHLILHVDRIRVTVSSNYTHYNITYLRLKCVHMTRDIPSTMRIFCIACTTLCLWIIVSIITQKNHENIHDTGYTVRGITFWWRFYIKWNSSHPQNRQRYLKATLIQMIINWYITFHFVIGVSHA